MYVHLTHRIYIFCLLLYLRIRILPCRDITNSFRFGFSCSFFFLLLGVSLIIYTLAVSESCMGHHSRISFFSPPLLFFFCYFNCRKHFLGGFVLLSRFFLMVFLVVYVGLYLRGLFFSSSPGARCSVKNQRNVGQVAACHRKMQ